MTYSTGPGGYGDPPQGAGGGGGQGYGQPSAGYGAAPGPGRGLGFYLNIGVIVLGLLSFFLGFAPYTKVDKDYKSSSDKSDTLNFFQNGGGAGIGTASLVALIGAALIAAFTLLPKQQRQDAVVAALSVTGFVSLLFLLFGLSGPWGAGVGLILVLITSFLQAAIAVVALLLGSGVVKPPAPRQAQYGYYGQPGYGQPQQQYYGPGAPGAPGGYSSQPLPQAQPPQQSTAPPSQPQPPQNPW